MSDRLRLRFLLAAALLVAPAVAAEPEDEAAALVERLEEGWEVLRLRDGYALRPRAERDDLELVEVAPDALAIDGEEVDEEELRDRVGGDAGEIVELSRLLAGGERPLELERSSDEVERELARALEERAERERRDLERRLADQRDALRRQMREVERQAERAVERRRSRDRGDQRVSFGTGLTLEEGQLARDVVVLLGSAVLRGDVRGSATAVGGSVEVDGEVTDDVVAVGGSVSLGPRARVGGDVVAIGGSVDRQPGAEVDGQVTEVSVAALAVPRAWLERWSSGWWGGWPTFGWHGLGGFLGGSGSLPERVGSAVLLALVLIVVVSLAPRRTAAVAERVELEPVKSLLTGVATEVLYGSVLAFLVFLLAITIIGLPLAFLLFVLGCMALVVALYLGYAGSALVVGRRLGDRLGSERAGLASGILAVLIGVAAIQGWSVIGKALSILPWPLAWMGVLVLLFGFGVRYLAWTAGLGALVLNQLAPLPALPPLPAEAPPEPSEPPADEGSWPEPAQRGDDDTGS